MTLEQCMALAKEAAGGQRVGISVWQGPDDRFNCEITLQCVPFVTVAYAHDTSVQAFDLTLKHFRRHMR